MTEPSKPNYTPAGGTAPQRDRHANRRKVHLKFLARRLEGGTSATPEAYARAIQQWQQLPGAVVSVPVTDLTRAQASPTPTDVSAVMSPSAIGPRNEEDGP
jgi:hypothetical protein